MLPPMRINKIKLAGFKSFVDPTTLHLPGNLTGIVGPNGCGKSNIIDAMMWVMGESSAKHLRGDSMADVIFSGSGSRKPVGQAAVEIIFDNSDGALGGAYASFAEISIKRTVARDGISSYFLNGTRCRRKDIVDVFLGTGLGVRGGYSVIEQGMISRVIEARPEELRNFIEEAAGISRYKERRRETENRIRHTNENLARVNDVREELEKQLGHLQRQAKAAEKYQEYKAEERRLEAELVGLRWQRVETSRAEQLTLIETRETAVEAALATLRALEARQVELRASQVAAQDTFNARQSEFYAKSAEVSRLEQTLQHNEDRRKAFEQDLARARFNLEETSRLHAEDTQRQATLEAEIAALTPEMEAQAAAEEEAAQALRQVEASAEDWQQSWDTFNREQAGASRLEHAEQVRLELLQKGFVDAQARAQRLQDEQASLAASDVEASIEALAAELAEREADYDRLTDEQQEVRSRLQTARQEAETASGSLHSLRSELQKRVGEEASLQALQQAALGRDARSLTDWLARHGLADKSLLASQMTIESGWELAVEVALRLPLSTLCEPDLVRRMAITPTADLPVGRLAGLEHGVPQGETGPRAGMPALLAARIESPLALQPLLAGVHAVADIEEAMALRPRLQAHESAITPQGVWVGPNWVQLPGRETVEAGVLARQRALETLSITLESLREAVAATEQTLATARETQGGLEVRERELTAALQRTFTTISQLKGQLSLKQAERARVEERRQGIAQELAQLAVQAMEHETTLDGLRERVESFRDSLAALAARGDSLNQRRREVQAALETARNAWRAAREARHALALRLEGLRSTGHSLVQALARNARLAEELKARCTDLEGALGDTLEPREELDAQLQRALAERQALEAAMKASRETLEACDSELRATDEEGVLAGRELAQRQQALEQVRLEERALQVRAQELTERLEQQGQILADVLAGLPEEAEENEWRQRLETVGNRITRLGPINLAAIDEFAQLSERKTYLDNQLADLNQALATLQEAMQKIDRETRTRFRETFDAVNEGMQRLFPVLFGGGQASLELTNEDLLEAGVTVMARPPGKRNSTIHLLSGGEKALTALSFVFSLFELNPAPFCLLDEVDAPLDDANVVRLTELLKSMADRVQFLFISHNKITMEIASQLIGVTMHEAGVSRLVSVNMEEAVALAHTA